MSKVKKLKELLKRRGPILVVGCHNGLTSKIAEITNFDMTWASSFETSASYAMPDANILTMSDNMIVAKNINDGSKLPMIVDCDNGYGNAINVIHAVKEYEKMGAAAIVIEDNVFPKRCSFYAGVKRELECPDEFSGKIRAGIANKKNPDFMIFARTEALIAGWGIEEGIKRCNKYLEAGADGLFVHSKSTDINELKTFMERFRKESIKPIDEIPMIAVPTTYDKATAQELYDLGFNIVIYANHGVRTVIKQVTETFEILRKEQNAASVKDRIVTLPETFEIIGVPILKENEKKFLLSGGTKVNAIIVSAGKSEKLGDLIKDKPLAMLDIKGTTVLEKQIESFNENNIKDITVVRGYKKEQINMNNINYCDNESWDQSYILGSLMKAQKKMTDRWIFCYGDIIFEKNIVDKLLKCTSDIVLVGDYSWLDLKRYDKTNPPELLQASCNIGERFMNGEEHQLVDIGDTEDLLKVANSEFVGLAMFNGKGTQVLKNVYENYDDINDGLSFIDVIKKILEIRDIKISVIDTHKGWLEIDTFEDYQRAWSLLK